MSLRDIADGMCPADAETETTAQAACGAYAGMTYSVSALKESLGWTGKYDFGSKQWDGEMWLKEALDDAVRLGFYAAQAEAKAYAHPLAQQRLRRQRSEKVNGKLTGAQSARIADIWRQPGLKLATMLRAEDPSLGQLALAKALLPKLDEAVGALLQRTRRKLPEIDQLKTQIRAWEEAGELVRSSRYPRQAGG
jgi:hypothetical protein